MTAGVIRTEVLIVGAGLAGAATALELLARGRRVVMVDAGPRPRFGGEANDAFGGMLLIGTREQRRARIHDSPELLFADWARAARFASGDVWGRRWAQAYAEHCTADVYDWLRALGVRFMPMVQWVERGNFGDGNSLPRYHIAWGCGAGIAGAVIARLQAYAPPRFAALFDHRVTGLERTAGRVGGCRGDGPDGAFRIEAEHVVVCSGGINGNLAKVRAHWDVDAYGPPPAELLAGAHPAADGSMHDAVADAGGAVVRLGQMWNYAAGVAHPAPRFPQHGLSLVPPRSALWLDARGRRIGPHPLVTGFDTHDLCARIGRLPGQSSWQVMNFRIAARELAVSGTEANPLIRDHRFLRLVYQTLTGNRKLVRWLLDACPDAVSAPTLDALAVKMDAVGGHTIDRAGMRGDIEAYDAQIARGPALWNDDQLRRIAQLRRWRPDRMRTCRFQRILEPAAGPLIAIRERLISRKTMGGMLTDLDARVLGADGAPIPGLYAAGEAAGFGGGGICGVRSLEGTFLSNCVFNGRRAARAIAGA